MRSTTVFICDDSELICHGLKHALASEAVEVVGFALSATSAMDAIPRLAPNVVLMDISMPEMDGIEATRKLIEADPQLKIMMFTSSDDPESITASFAAGAVGYCIKRIKPEDLAIAIHAVSAGAGWLDPSIAGRILPLLASADRVPQTAYITDKKNFPLTPREQEVLVLMANGFSNAEIAGQLTLSSETVKSHVRRIFDKLVVKDRTEAVVKAVRSGLIAV